MRLGRARATRLAASIGQGMAILFGVAGVFGNPILIFIALFVYLAAEAEARLKPLPSSTDCKSETL
jgi:Zn-dependent protease